MLEHVLVRFRMDMQNCTGNDGGYVITLLIPVRRPPEETL
jgi:hypothetical protein